MCITFLALYDGYVIEIILMKVSLRALVAPPRLRTSCSGFHAAA